MRYVIYCRDYIVKQSRRERNKLLKQLQRKLDEIKEMGKSGVVSQNIPKKPKRVWVKKETKKIVVITPPPEEKRLENIKEGTVKCFFPERSFGFIAGNDGVDYFFHITALVDADYLVPAEGDAVFFKGEKATKGTKAVQVSKQK